jgi:hypothetical protein
VIVEFCFARGSHEHQELVGKAQRKLFRGHEFGSIGCLTEERIIVVIIGDRVLEPGVFPLFMAIGPVIFCILNR